MSVALCRNQFMKALEHFIEKHKDSEFLHKEELFIGLYSGKCVLDQSPESHQYLASCSELLTTHRLRAEHLRHYKTPHARRLREDTLAFCDELAKTLDERCRLWIFSMPPYCNFIVFEGAESKKILGCILAADKRLTPPDEWEGLWHGESGSV